MPERLKILDIWVDPLTRDAAIERARKMLREGTRPHSIFASNPEKNFTIPEDPVLYKVYREADMLLPDGIGMVLAGRLLYRKRFSRLPGSEFIFDLCRLAVEGDHGVFVYGAREEVNAGAVRILEQRFPGIRIVGRSNGYVPESEMEQLVERINDSKAAILFVALGSPRQEKWVAAHRDSLSQVKICQGVGGTLDTITGHVKRAPLIWCRYNLEWLYRLLSEPSRISRQKLLPVFATMVLLEKCRLVFFGVRR